MQVEKLVLFIDLDTNIGGCKEITVLDLSPVIAWELLVLCLSPNEYTKLQYSLLKDSTIQTGAYKVASSA